MLIDRGAMKPKVYLMCGLPGAGKTTYTKTKLKGIKRLSTDEIVFDRHGECGVDYPKEDYHKYYSPVKKELEKELVRLLMSGESVILDYGFWSKKGRDKYKKLIEDNGGECILLYFKINKKILLKRLSERNKITSANTLTVSKDDLEEYIDEFEEPNEEEEVIV